MASQPEVAIDTWRPDGWFDKSMIIYSAPAEQGVPIAPNIVVARDALGRNETFREYCNRQIDGFRATLPHFHRESEGAGRVHDLDAFQIQLTWTSGAGPLRQRVFFISTGAGVVVTYTATAAADDFDRHGPAFEQGLARLVIGPVR